MTGILKSFLPHSLKSAVKTRLEQRAFERLPRQSCDTSALRGMTRTDLDQTLAAAPRDAEWAEITAATAPFGISQAPSGVNDGDRRAIWQLVRGLGAHSVLEVGTSIGASTIHFAQGLRQNAAESGQPVRMVSVDIEDMNDPATARHVKLGLPHAPRAMLERLGCDGFTRFEVADSTAWLQTCREKFDLIFLDGDHGAGTVYRELPAALRLLNPGGVILLHDYFPDGKPLWSHKGALMGPFVAIRRLLAEGADFTVLSLGGLEWETKRGTTLTTLALVVGGARGQG